MTRKQITKLIQEIEKTPLKQEVIEEINKIFFTANERLPEDYDLILVLSSSSINRMKLAISLYHQRQTKILISGGTYLEKEKLIEAEMFYIYAICHGIPSNDLILELQSKNTYENFVYALDIIKKNNLVKQNLVLITNANHMPRAIRTGMKVVNEKNLQYKFYPQKSMSTMIRKDTWQENRKAIKIIKGELTRLLKYDLIKK